MQTILVCDDDKQIVEAINIYLTGEGFEVIKAYDGYEALEYLEDHEVNLMIVDVELLGGVLNIRWDRENDRVYMTGPAVEVYHGEIGLKENNV